MKLATVFLVAACLAAAYAQDGTPATGKSHTAPLVPAFCVPTCGNATNGVATATCPPGTTADPAAPANLTGCYYPCPTGWTGAGSTCQITSCPPPWEPTTPPDADLTDGLNCRKPCGFGREYQTQADLTVPVNGCYDVCSAATFGVPTFGAAIVISDRTAAMCCTGTCPGGVWSWVGGGVATCVGGANDGQQARCYDRSLSFKPATTKTFVNFERKSVTPQCLLASGAPAFGYKPFKDAAGAWRCWTCTTNSAPSVLFQEADKDVVCLCPQNCPYGTRWCYPMCWGWGHNHRRDYNSFCSRLYASFPGCIATCPAPPTVGK